ncbi:MAG: hypothetical protein GF315_11080 [candidate division Zixibacteria bacterium]|nr:hypothetical protein [candidate division Zixibacteria bacterium]
MLKRKNRNILIAALVLSAALFILYSANLEALPEFSVRYGQNCQLCHHNPVGGGMRALFGAQFFSYSDLPWEPEKDIMAIEDKVNPLINDNFQVGFDFRTLFYAVDEGENSFMSMQGDLYAGFIPGENLLLYLDKGLRGNFEAYALIQGLPYHTFIKAGRFIPGYGWRLAEHKAFVREKLGFGLEGEEDGVEAGIVGMTGDISLAITNGKPTTIVDVNEAKALTARASHRFTLGGLNLTVGGSYRYAEIGDDIPLNRYSGLFGGFQIGRLIYLAEGDLMVNSTTGFVSTQKAVIHLRQGWDLDLIYDYYDPDIDYQTGYDYRIRMASHFYLTGYMELIPAYEWKRESGDEFGTGEIQLHGWF